MKELEELDDALTELLLEYDKQVKEFMRGASGYPSITVLKGKILNLKGDGWEIAIIHNRVGGETLDGFRIVKVIWQGE